MIKKIDKCHFCHHLKVMCWYFLSFVEIDVFLLVKWVCKIHRKQVTRNNSEKLIIILQYKNMFKKNQNISTIASKYLEFSVSQELPLLKNDDKSNN